MNWLATVSGAHFRQICGEQEPAHSHCHIQRSPNHPANLPGNHRHEPEEQNALKGRCDARSVVPMSLHRGRNLRHVADNLAEEMRLHMAEPFPDSVEKGLDYGEVDAVMIGADIYGWATRAGSLSELDRTRLSQAADELQRSIDAFPSDAQAYYERILRIARLVLAP
jgi:hypothetical protein